MPTFTNLSSLTKYTRRPIMQKVQCHNHLSILSQFATTGSYYICLSVSGFSVFNTSLYSFHLSLTVLVHYRLFRFLGLVSVLPIIYEYYLRSSGKITRLALLKYCMAMTDTGTLTLYGGAQVTSQPYARHSSCCHCHLLPKPLATTTASTHLSLHPLLRCFISLLNNNWQ